MFHGGKLKSMPPKLVSDNGEHIVIRPLAYCSEKDIERYSELVEFPIIPCNLCGSQENLQRKNIKMMMQTWDKQFPGRIESMARALQNVTPSHLADADLFNFANLKVQDTPFEGGDIGFDAPDVENETDSKETAVQIINIA